MSNNSSSRIKFSVNVGNTVIVFKKQTDQNNPVQSKGVLLQGKKQIQFVCVTSSSCGRLWGGWRDGD